MGSGRVMRVRGGRKLIRQFSSCVCRSIRVRHLSSLHKDCHIVLTVEKEALFIFVRYETQLVRNLRLGAG